MNDAAILSAIFSEEEEDQDNVEATCYVRERPFRLLFLINRK